MARLEVKMDAGFARLDGKIDAGLEKLNGKIDTRTDAIRGRQERDFRLAVGMLIAAVLGLAALMAHGFKWMP